MSVSELRAQVKELDRQINDFYKVHHIKTSKDEDGYDNTGVSLSLLHQIQPLWTEKAKLWDQYLLAFELNSVKDTVLKLKDLNLSKKTRRDLEFELDNSLNNLRIFNRRHH